MKKTYEISAVSALCWIVWAAGCGTGQPKAEVQPPELTPPAEGTCPGAMPGMNVQVTGAIGESNAPVITWTGEAFAVSWWDLRGQYPEVRLLRIDRDGVNRSPAARIPNKEAARDQSMAWDGKELHLVFRDGNRIMSARLGTADEEPKVLTENGNMAAAGPWGAAVWVDAGKLMFQSDGMIKLSDDGEVEEAPAPVVIARGGIEDPQIAFNGKFYAVAWSKSVRGGREIALQRVSPKGRKLGGLVKVSATAGVSRKPVIVWTQETFAMSWTNAAPVEQNPQDNYRVFFALVPEVGDTPSMTRQLEFQGSADQVALASTGKEFAMAWVGSRKPMGSAIYFQRIGLDGKPLDSTTEVTDGVPMACGRPSVAWDGDGYGVAWHDDRAQTGSEVFFAYIECGEEVPLVEQPGPQAAPDAGPPPAAESQVSNEPPVLKDVFSDKDAQEKPNDKPKKSSKKK